MDLNTNPFIFRSERSMRIETMATKCRKCESWCYSCRSDKQQE